MTLTDLLKQHEGWRRFPYLDTKGIYTIGCGRNLTYDGLRDDEIDLMLRNDIAEIRSELGKRDWWVALDPVRQDAICDVAMMGVSKLDKFVKMIAALRMGDWERAALELLDSQWARDVHGKRAGDIAHMIRTATYPQG